MPVFENCLIHQTFQKQQPKIHGALVQNVLPLWISSTTVEMTIWSRSETNHQSLGTLLTSLGTAPEEASHSAAVLIFLY